MKMRNTIYPVVLIIALSLIFIVFYVLNQGRFLPLVDQTEVTADHDEWVTEFHFEWRGFGHPEIQSVDLMDNLPVRLEVTFLEKGQATDHPNIPDAELPNLSVLIQSNNPEQTNPPSIQELNIRYKTFGVIREQIIALNEGTP